MHPNSYGSVIIMKPPWPSSLSEMRDAGAEALAKALESGTSAITMMDLSPNKIGDKGAEALARALQIMKKRGDLKKMTNIYLHGNPIGEAGKRALRPFTDQKIIDWSAA
jgi:hypothetical protein